MTRDEAIAIRKRHRPDLLRPSTCHHCGNHHPCGAAQAADDAISRYDEPALQEQIRRLALAAHSLPNEGSGGPKDTRYGTEIARPEGRTGSKLLGRTAPSPFPTNAAQVGTKGGLSQGRAPA